MLNPTANIEIINAFKPIEKILEITLSLIPMVIPITNNKNSKLAVCIVFSFPSNFGDSLSLYPISPPSTKIPKYLISVITT